MLKLLTCLRIFQRHCPVHLQSTRVHMSSTQVFFYFFRKYVWHCDRCNFDCCSDCLYGVTVPTTHVSHPQHPLQEVEEGEEWNCSLCPVSLTLMSFSSKLRIQFFHFFYNSYQFSFILVAGLYKSYHPNLQGENRMKKMKFEELTLISHEYFFF